MCGAADLDYILALITEEETPPLVHFLREAFWDQLD